MDLLVHGARDHRRRSTRLETAALDDLDAQYQDNVRAPYALTQRALLPALRERQGDVVFLNSTAGPHGLGGIRAIRRHKARLTAVADSLRAEVNADGVRVLSVFLGPDGDSNAGRARGGWRDASTSPRS